MEKLTPLEKIKAALKAIDNQRRLSDRDDFAMPESKFHEEGLDDPADIETLLVRFRREGIIEKLDEIKDTHGLRIPLDLVGLDDPLGETPPTHHLKVIPEEFDKYFEGVKAQLPELDEEKQEHNLEDVLKGAGIKYDTNTGEFNYGKGSGKLRPTSYQGRALILLLKNVNQELDPETVWKAMEPYEKFQPSEDRGKVHNTMSNLRKRLDLSPSKLKRAHNYYTLVD